MADDKKQETVKGLRVTSRPPVFRRAGRTFTAEPTDIPLTDLTEAEVKRLEGEKSLVTQRLDIKAPPKAEVKKASEDK